MKVKAAKMITITKKEEMNDRKKDGSKRRQAYRNKYRKKERINKE
jgi:hypothetical protein